MTLKEAKFEGLLKMKVIKLLAKPDRQYHCGLLEN